MTTRRQIIEAVASQTNFEIDTIIKGPVIAGNQKWVFEIKGEKAILDLFVPNDTSLSAFDVDIWVDSLCDAYKDWKEIKEIES